MLAIGAWSAAASAGATSVPAKDTFTGSVAGASGALKGDRGAVTVLLHVGSSVTATRPIRLVVRGADCGTRKHCLRLIGTLAGTLRAQPSIPDVGRRFDVAASGRLAPIGRVNATGVITTPGFIRQGREHLMLTLRTSRAVVTINALSPAVPGQSSP